MSTCAWVTVGVAVAAVCCVAMQLMRDVGHEIFSDLADVAELALFPLCAALVLFPVAQAVT